MSMDALEISLLSSALIEVAKKLADAAGLVDALKTSLTPFRDWLTADWIRKRQTET